MNGFDLELELLAQGIDLQSIGDHELKTSPLVSRDAANQSPEFLHRGLLGSVLSLHADNLPTSTKDPRLYLNLAAPASGLVCGVQGSGKSHTVSCILESSLMGDPRVGTLPAPLATVVFHFDEENGGRPCEAAYLSELNQGGGKGVKEVVVLTSPSNIQTRRRVYSSLKYVKVEPLRVAEEDLNAPRMLSMMGADNLEVVPLYLHTALSILREMGSDGFTYKGFRERLAASDFNKSQGAMLQLRLDLLHSFLQGTGNDVSSFFKSGRLIIIDLSDPFIDAMTAAMLFDICLGLFIEWKTATGKLIVLDEAHKYLTNTDANRFTKSICSIIRQQRHLAARVVVSTQEPTVVPASVLDLLSWIICHRFSSPSWVKHMKQHVCVNEEDHERQNRIQSEDQLLGNTTDRSTEWGKRVMTLRTGEAILYSPAALFVSAINKLTTLASGYAIIKSRPRLTRDGGASILAAKDTEGNTNTITNREPIPAIPAISPIGSRSRSSTGLATPSSLNSSISSDPLFTPSPPARTSGYTVMPGTNVSFMPTTPRSEQVLDQWARSAQSPQSFQRLPTPTFAQPSTLISPPATSRATSIPISTPSPVPVTKSPVVKPTPSKATLPPAASRATSIPISTPPPVPVTKSPIAKPTPPNTAPANSGGPTSYATSKFRTLVMALERLQSNGGTKFASTDVANTIHKISGSAYSGKLSKYLKEAQAAGVVTLTGKDNTPQVSLHPSLAATIQSTRSVQPTQSTKTTSSSSASSTQNQQQSAQSHAKFAPLLDALRTVAVPANIAVVGEALKKRKFSYKEAGYSKLVTYIEAAEAKGLVTLQRRLGAVYVGLAPNA